MLEVVRAFSAPKCVEMDITAHLFPLHYMTGTLDAARRLQWRSVGGVSCPAPGKWNHEDRIDSVRLTKPHSDVAGARYE